MITTRTVHVGDIAIGGKAPFALITGPCQLESLDHARMMAERIAEACAPTGTSRPRSATGGRGSTTR